MPRLRGLLNLYIHAACVRSSWIPSLSDSKALDDDCILRNASGVTLCLPHDVSDIVTQSLLLHGWWQPHLSMFMDALLVGCLDFQCTFVDVGAHVGWYTLRTALHHPDVNIVAVEPLARNVALLKRNLMLNDHLLRSATSDFGPRIELHAFAASNMSRTCAVVTLPANRGASVATTGVDGKVLNELNGILACGDRQHKALRTLAQQWLGHGGVASLRRLDELVQKPVQILKVDVEGHELWAMHGATDLFDHWGIEYVIFEFDPPLLRLQGTDPLKLLDFLADRHYSFFMPYASSAPEEQVQWQLIPVWLASWPEASMSECSDALIWLAGDGVEGHWSNCAQGGGGSSCTHPAFRLLCAATCERCLVDRRSRLMDMLDVIETSGPVDILASRLPLLPSTLDGILKSSWYHEMSG